MPDPEFLAQADDLCRELAEGLPQPCRLDFLRLTKSLLHGPSFQWMLAQAHDDRLRERLIDAIDRVLRVAHMDSSRLPLGPDLEDAEALEQALIRHAKGSAAVHVLGRRDWFDAKRWDGFNVRRERLAARARARLIFWLDAEAIASAAQGAPDLWAWRAGIYTFDDPTSAPAPAITREAVPSPPAPIDTRSAAERQARIDEIRRWLEANPSASADKRVAPYDELGLLLYSLGDYDAAEQHWRERELPLHRERHDEHAVAIILGQIADVLQARGQLEEALHIRREDELPVYERLGDVRSHAVTMGQIADILQARGQLDEALRIRREDELPVYERLGDMHERAVTIGKIADILQVRGQIDEALRIRREDELPIYERLGDMRSRAVTMGKVADLLQARGQLDEALRIRREDELPVYEHLGDVRARAIVRWKIARQLFGQIGTRAQAERLYREALAGLRQLGSPHAQTLAAEMKTHGIDTEVKS